MVFINQVRQKIGVVYGSPETTTGGNALKFYATIRMDIRRTGGIKQGDEILGQVHLPPAVRGDEVVVGDGGSLLQLAVHPLGGLPLLTGHIPGEIGPDGLLELGGLGGADGQDGGKTELADDLGQLRLVIMDTGMIGIEHGAIPLTGVFLYCIPNGRKSQTKLPSSPLTGGQFSRRAAA